MQARPNRKTADALTDGGGHARRARTVYAASAALLFSTLCSLASGSEYGISTYRPGLMDLFAGYLGPPGSTLSRTYFMFQDASQSAVTENGRIQVNSKTLTYTVAQFAAHVTTLSLLGSYWSFGTIVQVRIAAQRLHVGPIGRSVPLQTSTIGGPGDLILLPIMLNWNRGQFHFTTAFAVYAPTGSYDRQRIIDIGVNRWAVEPDLGFTWLDEEHGRHVSIFIGYTVNTQNTATDYTSGDEFHADFAFAQHLSYGLIAGVTGYALQQTTPDYGGGAIFGSYRGRVLGLGPLLGETIEIWNRPINFIAKYDFEFSAQNRAAGNELWLTGGFRF